MSATASASRPRQFANVIAVRREDDCGRLDDGVRLGGQRVGHPNPPGDQLDDHAIGERHGQERKRAGAPRQLEIPRGELVPRLIIGQRPGDTAGQPQPAQPILLGQRRITERPQRDLQRRRPRDIALAGEDGEPVQEQVARTRGGCQSAADSRGDLARSPPARPVGERSRKCSRYVSRASLDRAARVAWPRDNSGGAAAPRHREGDLRVQQLGARLLELIKGPPASASSRSAASSAPA